MTSGEHSPLTQSLRKISTEAEHLKDHRKDAVTYLEKCDSLVACLNQALSEIDLSELTDRDKIHLNQIKSLILTEEHFAKASDKIRDPDTWLEHLKQQELFK